MTLLVTTTRSEEGETEEVGLFEVDFVPPVESFVTLHSDFAAFIVRSVYYNIAENYVEIVVDHPGTEVYKALEAAIESTDA